MENAELKLRNKHIAAMHLKTNEAMNFDDTLKNGLIEFLDVEEEETAMIAMHVSDLAKNLDPSNKKVYQYTHCEIHPSMILGVCASIIPFPDHNQVSFYFNYSNFVYSHRETPTKVLWESRLWESTFQIIQ